MKTLAFLLLFSVAVAHAAADKKAAYALELWSDPQFARFFLGTYSVLPEVEPPLNDKDKETLQRILPLMPRPVEAAAALLKIINKDSNAAFDLTLANLYLENNQLENAQTMFKKAIDKFPAFRRAWRGMGIAHIRKEQWDEAVNALGRAISLGAADGPSYGLYGSALLSSGRAVSAESAFRNALMFQPDVLDWKMGLLQCLLKEQKASEAAALCDELIRENPDRTEFLTLQSEAYLSMKDTVRAAENLEVLARGGKAKPEELARLGDIYLVGKDSALAASAYLRALEAGPVDAAKVVAQAENLAAQNALPEAADLIKKARSKEKLSPENEARLLKVEARIAVNSGRAGDSVPLLQRVVELNPLDGGALMLLGQHFSDQKDDIKATALYERASKLKDFEADASLRLAQLHVGAGRLTDALPLLKRSNEIKPRDAVGRLITDIERALRKTAK
ncbi:MAG: tetratricopeptide repeat protein [Verrucomicrobiaceae bacterium]|nr:tetratricopeptide repeat protein [Verrucomicrobiaceae bacterium]